MRTLLLWMWVLLLPGCLIIEVTKVVGSADSDEVEVVAVDSDAPALDTDVVDSVVVDPSDPDCVACSEVVDGPACDPLGLGEPGAGALDALLFCSCGSEQEPGPCAEACDDTVCSGEPATNSCKACLATSCADALQDCLSDVP